MPTLYRNIGHNEDIIGVVPYIRIHDYICIKADIVKLVLYHTDFLPTIYLKIVTPSNSLNETDKLNDGDTIQIGIRSDLKVFESISVDFLVTKVYASKLTKNQNHTVLYEYVIFGELNVPLLDSQNIKFSYQGTAEEALQEIAKRIGLGYVENKSNPKSPDKNTRTLSIKKETWDCYSSPREFIHDVTKHMWAGEDSFFETWIDPYLNLVNVNVGDMLGRHIEDDGIIDETKIRSIIATAPTDGKFVHNDLGILDDYKDNKMFTNDKSIQTSVWFVNEYYLDNQSTKVTKKVSAQKDYTVYIQNNGLGQSENESEHKVNVGVWYNKEKVSLGYVTMNGPAKEDRFYKKANNGSYKEHNLHYNAPEIIPIQSDGDEDERQGSKSNKNTSGNFSKEYALATDHNKLNLGELDKQLLYLKMTGFNNGFAKGEKLPCVLYRQSDEKWVNEKRKLRDNHFLFDPICSGWFYVKGAIYKYEPKSIDTAASDWETTAILTRREWFPPEATSTADMAGDKNNTVDSKSISDGTTQLNDVTSGATDAAAPKSSSASTKSSNPETPAVQTEMAGMADEIQNNIESLEKNKDVINALNALENVEDALNEIENVEDVVQTKLNFDSLKDVEDIFKI